MRVCIVIPAYEPGGEFVPYAQEVLAAGLGPVLVVDDGSGPAYAPVFAALAEMGCTVLTHEQNRGKGAALKTALRWYGAHEDGCAGIVTADCDGQHTVKDVRRVCEAMEACRARWCWAAVISAQARPRAAQQATALPRRPCACCTTLI